jgi:hypothetical protein
MQLQEVNQNAYKLGEKQLWWFFILLLMMVNEGVDCKFLGCGLFWL